MFNLQALLESLPMMGYGMLGIFIAVAVIILAVIILGKIFPAKK
ncbi:MAG: oxaloacetate decarboxylase [Oscillospiraceae bacterium]|nr:oxaloacetate decarboxylase [Oscillospiraceae bacterium]MDD5921475.1 OadG-related small transporter subunit [Oscillospiraceae bacterium]HAG57554.1 oxaloacetate decarboxylase [Oscillospiraceae bacterium]HAO69473.1 oxaloacetate decarboxylase [Oscillospiraceae bacterium]